MKKMIFALLLVAGATWAMDDQPTKMTLADVKALTEKLEKEGKLYPDVGFGLQFLAESIVAEDIKKAGAMSEARAEFLKRYNH